MNNSVEHAVAAVLRIKKVDYNAHCRCAAFLHLTAIEDNIQSCPLICTRAHSLTFGLLGGLGIDDLSDTIWVDDGTLSDAAKTCLKSLRTQPTDLNVLYVFVRQPTDRFLLSFSPSWS